MTVSTVFRTSRRILEPDLLSLSLGGDDIRACISPLTLLWRGAGPLRAVGPPFPGG